MAILQRASRQRPQRLALRLSFQYRGEDVRLASVEHVEMVPPPPDPPSEGESTGFWYELLDRSGRTAYRRVTTNPIRSSAEVLTDDAGRPLARQDTPTGEGTFVLLAPAITDVSSIALYASPPGIEGMVQPARQIATFNLTAPTQREGE